MANICHIHRPMLWLIEAYSTKIKVHSWFAILVSDWLVVFSDRAYQLPVSNLNVLRKICVIGKNEEVFVPVAGCHVSKIEVKLTKLGGLVCLQRRYTRWTEVRKSEILVWIIKFHAVSAIWEWVPNSQDLLQLFVLEKCKILWYYLRTSLLRN